MAWIDIAKVYDTVSHEFILLVLQHLKVHPGVLAVVRELIARWRTIVAVGGCRTEERTQMISYKKGIFQGDSLSPLLFCLVLRPLSLALRGGCGYMAGKPNNRKHKVTHLLYMDDLKIYGKNLHDLQKMVNVTQEYIHNKFRHDIQRKQVRHIPPRARKECHGGGKRDPAGWKYHKTPPTKQFIYLSRNKTEGNARYNDGQGDTGGAIQKDSQNNLDE
ncbi:hypothetical protein Trydic_g11123 [Trypoxylus dichotomus]